MKQMSFMGKRSSSSAVSVQVQGNTFTMPTLGVSGVLDPVHSLAIIENDMEYQVARFTQDILDATGVNGLAVKLPMGLVAYCAFWLNMCQDMEASGTLFVHEDSDTLFGPNTRIASINPHKFAHPGGLKAISGLEELESSGANRGVYAVRCDVGTYRLLDVKAPYLLLAGDILLEEDKVLEYDLVYAVTD